jgi:hypothetical protein
VGTGHSEYLRMKTSTALVGAALALATVGSTFAGTSRAEDAPPDPFEQLSGVPWENKLAGMGDGRTRQDAETAALRDLERVTEHSRVFCETFLGWRFYAGPVLLEPAQPSVVAGRFNAVAMRVAMCIAR